MAGCARSRSCARDAVTRRPRGATIRAERRPDAALTRRVRAVAAATLAKVAAEPPEPRAAPAGRLVASEVGARADRQAVTAARTRAAQRGPAPRRLTGERIRP